MERFVSALLYSFTKGKFMTTKLYDTYPYETSFDAVVLECEKRDDFYYVVLDKTLFFPLEGGQSPDKGKINDIEVLDVKIKSDIISHKLLSPVEVGTIAHGEIDWDHRFKNMQMHSGEHIFTGLIHKYLGYDNVGFHLSDNSATMDYNGKISDDELRKFELLANQIIVQNKAIKAYYPDKEELASLDYRSKKEINGDIRIVIVEDVDICACCAPHVQKTGEIGMFKIISSENYKGGTRVNYLCGFRALNYFNEKLSDLKIIQNCLSVKSGNEAEATTKLYDSFKSLNFDYTGAKNKLIELQIENEYDKYSPVGYWIGEKEDSQYMKYAIKVLHFHYDFLCVALAGDDESGYRYIIECPKKDLSTLSNMLKEKFDAKGGGRNESIQGTVFAKKEELIEFLNKNSHLFN